MDVFPVSVISAGFVILLCPFSNIWGKINEPVMVIKITKMKTSLLYGTLICHNPDYGPTVPGAERNGKAGTSGLTSNDLIMGDMMMNCKGEWYQ